MTFSDSTHLFTFNNTQGLFGQNSQFELYWPHKTRLLSLGPLPHLLHPCKQLTHLRLASRSLLTLTSREDGLTLDALPTIKKRSLQTEATLSAFTYCDNQLDFLGRKWSKIQSARFSEVTQKKSAHLEMHKL